LIRITNSQRSVENKKDSIYTKEEWDTVLNKMQSYGIKAIIVAETATNNPAHCTDQINNSYIDLINKFILDSKVLENPDVYALDLKNETQISENNISYIKKAAELVKQNYPGTKLTVGWWSVETQTLDENGNKIKSWNHYED